MEEGKQTKQPELPYLAELKAKTYPIQLALDKFGNNLEKANWVIRGPHHKWVIHGYTTDYFWSIFLSKRCND
jgi:hypothetical protein